MIKLEKEWAKLTPKDLEGLPRRNWDIESEYDCLLFCKGNKTSGFWSKGETYPYYDVIGIKDGQIEIAARMDDMNIGDFCEWTFDKHDTVYPFRMDCNRYGVFRFWGNNIKFIVGVGCSSTTVKIRWYK